MTTSRREFERDGDALDRDSSLIALPPREWLRWRSKLVPHGDQLLADRGESLRGHGQFLRGGGEFLRERGEFLPCCRGLLLDAAELARAGGEFAQYDRPLARGGTPSQRES